MLSNEMMRMIREIEQTPYFYYHPPPAIFQSVSCSHNCPLIVPKKHTHNWPIGLVVKEKIANHHIFRSFDSNRKWNAYHG